VISNGLPPLVTLIVLIELTWNLVKHLTSSTRCSGDVNEIGKCFPDVGHVMHVQFGNWCRQIGRIATHSFPVSNVWRKLLTFSSQIIFSHWHSQVTRRHSDFLAFRMILRSTIQYVKFQCWSMWCSSHIVGLLEKWLKWDFIGFHRMNESFHIAEGRKKHEIEPECTTPHVARLLKISRI